MYYNKQQVGTFRWIFNVRPAKGNQVHDSGIPDEYRGLCAESPVVTKPGEFLTL